MSNKTKRKRLARFPNFDDLEDKKKENRRMKLDNENKYDRWLKDEEIEVDFNDLVKDAYKKICKKRKGGK
jgi:hypothetical protein